MGVGLTEIVVDCHDPVAQAAFWAAALDYHVVRTEDAQVEIAPWEREPPDLADVPWVVLADPEGNEFCVLGSLAAT
jgi:Glyoxalase-like domain